MNSITEQFKDLGWTQRIRALNLDKGNFKPTSLRSDRRTPTQNKLASYLPAHN